MSEGIKHDSGKPNYSYLEPSMLEGVTHVFDFGARKYSRDNWKKLDNGVERFFNAALRHLLAINAGQTYDEESGLPHIDHAITSLLMAVWHSERDE